MLEVEVKAKIEDPSETEKIVLKKGGLFVKEVIEEDLYFSHPCRDFARTDEALRLRYVEDKTYLTYKGPKIDKKTKTREEFQVRLDSFQEGHLIFNALGFGDVHTVKKRRRYFKLEDYEVTIDSVEDLGDFIEIEAKDGYEPDKLLDLLSELGGIGSETKSYLELILEKKKSEPIQ